MNILNRTWAVVASIAILSAAVVSGAGLLTTATSVIGIIFVLCVANRIPVGNLIGALMALIFGVLSYQAGFIMNSVINIAVLMPLQVLAYFVWKQDLMKKVDHRVDVNKSIRGTFVFTGLLAAIFLIANIFTGAAMPLHDAVSASLVIGATLLLTFDTKKQWYLWIPYNALEVIMWFTAASLNPDVLAIAVMRTVFLINSLIGAYNWRLRDGNSR